MKKFIAIILTVIFVLSLTSCADPYGDVISQLEEMDMRGYFYTASQIESFTEENKNKIEPLKKTVESLTQ